MAATDKKKRLSDFDTPHTRVDEESDVEKRYTLGNMLGQGTFGTVLEVTNKCSGQQYAMKIVNKDKVGCALYRSLTRLCVERGAVSFNIRSFRSQRLASPLYTYNICVRVCVMCVCFSVCVFIV